MTIPWADLGQSGIPSSGSSFGLGALLFDRDDPPPTGVVASEVWPNGFGENAPTTWGVFAFDPPPFPARSRPADGTTIVHRGLNGATVQDTYAGGGGLCAGGIFGGGDITHTTDNLFVQNQADVSDFPCFSKSYLKFNLNRVPPCKAIISATLTIYEFGGSDPTQAQPSAVQLFTVVDDWDETTLTWNNAPIAHENVAMTQVPVMTGPLVWPGVPNVWDATQAVAEAYAAGRQVNVAIYSADTAYHSGKYFVSSDAGDWDAVGRPTLTIAWGNPSRRRSFSPWC